VPVCFLLTVVGFFLIGYFELNKVDDLHTLCHYIGVVGILLGSFSIGFVLNWRILASSLLAIQFSICVGWFLICQKMEMISTNPNVITRNSKICIGIEVAMLFVIDMIGALSTYLSR